MAEELKILGRVIGTQEDDAGWDTADEAVFMFYDFTPVEGVGLEPCSTLVVDYQNGLISMQDDDGDDVAEPVDIIALLKDLPREPS